MLLNGGIHMIENSEIIMMGITALVTVLLPFIFILVLRFKFKTRWLPILIGTLVFVVFALVLEQILHMIVLNPGVDGSVPLRDHSPWLFVLYGVLAAGIFEETGRLLAFLITKKWYKDIDSAISYGIGHGGIEAILVVGLAMVNSIIIAFMVNSGSSLLNDIPIPTEELVNSQAWYMYLLAIFERIIAMSLHIALSVIVFCAVMMKGKWYLYPLAILLHALANVTAAMMQAGLLTNSWLMYSGLIVVTAVVIFIAYRLIKKYQRDPLI